MGAVVDGRYSRRESSREEPNPDRPLGGSNALSASQRSTKREADTNCPGPNCGGEEGPTVHSAPSRQISAGCHTQPPLSRDFRFGPTSPLPRGVERADHPVAQLAHPFQQIEGSHARDAWTVRGLALGSLVNPTTLFGYTSAASTPAPLRLRSRVGLSITSDAMRAARCAG